MWAIVLGVVGIALTAPARTTTHTSNLTVTLVLVGIGVLAMLPYAISLVRRPAASLTMIGAGLGFAWSGVATKLASDDLARGSLALAAAWGISTAEYERRADVWPLNPEGDLLAIPMIETLEGLKNVDEIAATPGIAAIQPIMRIDS